MGLKGYIILVSELPSFDIFRLPAHANNFTQAQFSECPTFMDNDNISDKIFIP